MLDSLRHWWTEALPAAAASRPSELPKVRGRAGAMIAASLSLQSVERRYRQRTALDGVDLDVAPGEIVCLLGPSGCGKTTLLRVVSGIEKPSGGRVLIDGQEVAGPDRFVPPERRGVGLMFQDFALFPHLTILENVAFGLSGLNKADATRAATSVLERVGMASYAENYPHVLSGGQQQRVALARAIVPRPGVMLMDEPFSGLDVQLRDAMQEETLGLLRETRATSLIVTHHPEEALRLGDRIAVMRAGRIIQIGRAEELYHEPAALFVARLFSEINEVPVRVTGGAVASPFGSVAAPGLADGTAAVLCIRERGLTVTRSEDRKTGALSGRVLDHKFLGDVTRLDIAVDGFEAPLKARVAEREKVVKGQDVAVEATASALFVFAADAENLIMSDT